VPSGPGLRRAGRAGPEPKAPEETGIQRHRAMTWAARLKRVFALEITRCRRCGGQLRVIASIEEPEVIERILVIWVRTTPALTRPIRPGRRHGASACSEPER
jgi:hypothetical protein